MRQSGNSVTYTKERWYEFIIRMSPGCCRDSYNVNYEIYHYYEPLTQWIESLSVRLPTDNIWKYLMAKKYY